MCDLHVINNNIRLVALVSTLVAQRLLVGISEPSMPGEKIASVVDLI